MLGRLWIHMWDLDYLFQKFHPTFIGRTGFGFVCLFSSENGPKIHSYFKGVPKKVAMMGIFAPWKLANATRALLPSQSWPQSILNIYQYTKI